MFKFVADNVGGAGTKRKLTPGPCDSCKRRHKRCIHVDLPEQSSSRTASTLPGSSSPEANSERCNKRSRERSPGKSTDAPSLRRSNTDISDAATDAAAADPKSSTSPARVTSIRRSSLSQRPPALRSASSRSSNAHVRFVANLSPESAFIINNHQLGGSESISRHGVGLWLGQDENEKPTTAEEAQTSSTTMPTQAMQVLDGFTGLTGQTLLLSALRPALRRECLVTIPPDRELGLLSDLFFTKIDPTFPILRDEPWETHSAIETVTLKQCICLVASSDPAMRPHLRLPHRDNAVLSPLEFRARIAAIVKQSLDLGFIADKIVLLQVCTLMAMYTDDKDFGVLSKHYCSQAILYEQTLGFHVGWPDGKAGGERSRRIFWCIWVLDRLNAATNGRPTVIHRHDVDNKVMDSIVDQPAPFKLLIHIAQLLEHTISLYRPGDTSLSTRKKKTDTFEDLIERASAQNLSSSLLSSLELFYLSAVILQDRSSENQSSSELQGFFATRIVAIVSGEGISSLINWPVLPYAVTVAASVAYRSLRKGATPYSRRRAYTLFQDACGILDDLGKTFLSTREMARLARDTMQGVGRATERMRRCSVNTPNANAQDSTNLTLTDDVPSNERVPDPSRGVSQQTNSVVPGQSQPLLITAPATPAASAALYDRSFGAADSFNEYISDAELFGNFDPNFDLGRADAMFSANLDLNMPYFAEDWPEPGPYTEDVG